VGREGPRIYDSWAEVSFLLGSVETLRQQVSRWPGAVHKSFRSHTEAEEWLALTGPSE
ncbi:hypothetical protein C8R48DRAFT_618291, partial [Suillus tomentosus]